MVGDGGGRGGILLLTPSHNHINTIPTVMKVKWCDEYMYITSRKIITISMNRVFKTIININFLLMLFYSSSADKSTTVECAVHVRI